MNDEIKEMTLSECIESFEERLRTQPKSIFKPKPKKAVKKKPVTRVIPVSKIPRGYIY